MANCPNVANADRSCFRCADRPPSIATRFDNSNHVLEKHPSGQPQHEAHDGARKGAATRCRRYRFFHPPLCPGAPPVERGVGPNSGPDWRESVGWKILLPLTGPRSSGEGLRAARPGRYGSDSGPCISSRWGLWAREAEEEESSFVPPPRPPLAVD